MKIPTDIEIFGYKKAKITPEPTDNFVGETNYSVYRIQIDLEKLMIIDLGQGRQIRIRFNANKTDIGI